MIFCHQRHPAQDLLPLVGFPKINQRNGSNGAHENPKKSKGKIQNTSEFFLDHDFPSAAREWTQNRTFTLF
jgi:hypothetical protein